MRKKLVRTAAIWLPSVAIVVLAGVFPAFGKTIQYPLEALAVLTLAMLVFTYLVDRRLRIMPRERDLREEIAQEILAQRPGCPDHPWPNPNPACWECARDGAFQRAALIAAGKFGLIFPPPEEGHGR